MLQLPGTTIRIPARALETRPTRSPEAWAEMFLTVELYQDLEAMRVSRHRLALTGDWLAIGDFTQTREEYTATHALPGAFVYQALCILRPGTVLNIGRCSALFNHPGGSHQAEFLEGPLPRVFPIEAHWGSRAGHA
jgi:hypothetical protein